MIHDGSATIHHGGAIKAQDASTIQYGASTVQLGSSTVAPRPPPRTVFMMNRSDLRQIGKNRCLNDIPIHPERPRMTTNTSTVPLCMSRIPLRLSNDFGHAHNPPRFAPNVLNGLRLA